MPTRPSCAPYSALGPLPPDSFTHCSQPRKDKDRKPCFSPNSHPAPLLPPFPLLYCPRPGSSGLSSTWQLPLNSVLTPSTCSPKPMGFLCIIIFPFLFFPQLFDHVLLLRRPGLKHSACFLKSMTDRKLLHRDES